MDELTLDRLLEQIQSKDDAQRAAARNQAATLGALAVAPLARLASEASLEVARAANQALQDIVHHAGRPGAENQARAVSRELVKLLGQTQSLQFQRDVLWMIGEIGDEEVVEAVAKQLINDALSEDARMTLERVPGDEATAALHRALVTASDEEKPALAHSLRLRGVDIPGVPDLRLVPTRQAPLRSVK